MPNPTKPTPGKLYQLTATRYPNRIYRCVSNANGIVQLEIVKRDPNESVSDVSITESQFESRAVEVK